MAINYRQELNKEQHEVVTQADGPCLVLAGAGSGKTRTIVYRVAYLIESGVKPENILLLTFTNKAANEMLSRVRSLLKNRDLKNIWGGTFHHVANRILRKYAKLLGYTPKFTILDEEDSNSLIKFCLKELQINTKERRYPSPVVIKGIISYHKNSGRKMTEVVEMKNPNWLDIADELKKIYRHYEQKKKEGNLMDFDDLLLNLFLLLNKFPKVKKILSEKFHYILVDEYQDTNKIQAAIIRELAEVHKNVLVVGDDAQSIYSFRAADITNILNFPKIFPGAKTYHLETNYRSTPDILDLANAIISFNKNQFPKKLVSLSKKLVKPMVIAPRSADEEAEIISRKILELRETGVPMNKIAVLFRAAHHSQELEMELVRRDIPYDYRGGVKFFERAHIKDILAFLKIINNYKDEISWNRILNLQPNIGEVTAKKIISQLLKVRNIKDCLKIKFDNLTPKISKSWQELKSILQPLIKEESIPSELIQTISKSKYQEHLMANFQNYQERIDDLEQLAIFAERYENLNDFLAEITMQESFAALKIKPQRDQDDEERIVLSTIHQAKGLEWEAVFVINLTDQSLPNPRALKEEGGLEEERRLFYVAVTRAQKRLYLTYPLTGGYNSLYLTAPSPFLRELPEDIWQEEDNGIEKDYSSLADGGISYLPEIDEL